MPQRLGRPGYPPALLAAAVTVAALSLLPVAYVLGDTVSVGWTEAYALIVRPRVGELLRNTVLLTVIGMATSAALGTGLAWLVERTVLPGRRVWNVLLAAPLAVPAFVTSFGWVSLFPSVASPLGALLVITLAYYPLVYLPVAVTLRGLDPALEETAAALGLGTAATFRRVVLPQLRPALLGGSLLVGLHLLSEFGALQLLRVETFTTAIYDQYSSSFSSPTASTLAAVLLLLCALLLVGELRLRGLRRYARLGSGAARTVARRPLGRAGAPVLVVASTVVVLALGIPVGSIVRWLVMGTGAAFPVQGLLTSAGTSLALGAAAAVVTTVLALPVAVLAVRHVGRLSSTVERTTYCANALPGIVVALALVTVSLRVVEPLYQTTVLLLAAYAVLYLPRAVVTLRAALEQAPEVLDEVAQSLGASRWSTLRRVTLPLIGRGSRAGAALVFLGVVTELTATLLLAPLGTSTLATEFWSQSSQLIYGAAAPYAALMILLSAPATFLLTRDVRQAELL